MGLYKPGTSQEVTVGAASVATTNAFGTGTFILRIASTTDCHYVVEKTPTATGADTLLPAGEIEYIRVDPGQKIAFIQETAGGTAIATEMA